MDRYVIKYSKMLIVEFRWIHGCSLDIPFNFSECSYFTHQLRGQFGCEQNSWLRVIFLQNLDGTAPRG